LPADGLDHFGGGLRFAPDGTLYLSTGDAAMGLDDARMLLRPQDIDDLAGKLLRINSDGSASAGNPFLTDDPHANRSKVWSYGFRNPFRLAVDPATRVPVVGDVGSFYWEELNAARPGSNFGWPCYEGMYQHPTQMILPDCIAMYAAAVATAHPMYFYQNPIFTGGASVMAGTFNAGTAYPADFDGAFFFGDWAGAWIRALHVDSDGNLAPDSVNDVLSNAGAPVAFRGGPDGDVYYLTLDVLTGESQLRRVEYLPGNRPPVALATASPGGGAVPLTVEFSSDGSYDPDGDDVGYLWDFGDGATSTDEDPSHTFVTAGAYDVELTVSDEHGLAAGASLHIVAGRHPPVATITSPPAGGVYVEGASLPFSGSAFDKEDGALPGLDLSWRIVLHHCDAGGGCHTHPFWSQSGPDGTLPTPHHNNEVMYLEFTLTATDSDGLADSATATAGNDTDVDGLADHLEVLEFGTDRLRADTDGDGCSDGAELGDNERVGGQRAPLNPWDYFNPSEDGQNRIDDVIDVVEQAFVDAGQPGYRLETDRSFTSPALQDVGPPDGLQRVEDVLGIVAQYFHDCD
jgi:PKD repeat protein